MSDDEVDPGRRPDPAVQDLDVSRDVELGTANHADFTAPDTRPVADVDRRDLLAMLDSDSVPTRRRAILALAEREGDEIVRTRLLTASREDPDPEARQFAIEALARLGAGAEPIRSGLEDPDPWVRAETVVSLKKVDPGANLDAFEAALDDPHPAVRRNALISIHHVRGADAFPALQAALEDESERVREWAVRLLGTIDSNTAGEAIRDHLAEEASDVVREAGARALDDRVAVNPSFGGSSARVDDHVLNRNPGT